jgi:hypothetical protein
VDDSWQPRCQQELQHLRSVQRQVSCELAGHSRMSDRGALRGSHIYGAMATCAVVPHVSGFS